MFVWVGILFSYCPYIHPLHFDLLRKLTLRKVNQNAIDGCMVSNKDCLLIDTSCLILFVTIPHLKFSYKIMPEGKIFYYGISPGQ